MKVISVFDLLRAEQLAGMNQFDACHLDNADKVYDVLAKLGFDTTKGVHIYAAQHRTLANDVKLGYLFAGEYNFAREHIKGPYSTLADVMIAAQAKDQSLYEELYSMNTRCSGYGGNDALDETIPSREDNEYKAEEERLTAQIKQLEDVLLHIRGTQYKQDGSVKSLHDYRFPEEPAPKRKKKKKEGITDE